MNKNIILLATLLISSVAFSQVGINTENPKATLDILASPDKPEKIDGILIPRLTGDELKAKDALYGADQVAAMVYVTAPVSTLGNPNVEKTYFVQTTGFYHLTTNSLGNLYWYKVDMDANNGLHKSNGRIRLGGPLLNTSAVSGLRPNNRFSFVSDDGVPEGAYLTIRSFDNQSGGVYLGNPSHGVTRGFPNIGTNNNLGLFTNSGNLYLSTNGNQTGEFVLADNGRVGIGLGETIPEKILDIDAKNDAIKARNLSSVSDWISGSSEILVRDKTTGNINGINFIYKTSLTIAPGESASFTIPNDSYFSNALLTVTASNGCGRDMISTFNVMRKSLSFLGGIGRDVVGQPSVTPIPTNGSGSATWSIVFPGVASCAGGNGTQFDFTITKTSDTTYQVTNNGNINKGYQFTLVRN